MNMVDSFWPIDGIIGVTNCISPDLSPLLSLDLAALIISSALDWTAVRDLNYSTKACRDILCLRG